MKKRENYLLFVPSLLTDKATPSIYMAGTKPEKYEGLQTNEAVSKYLADLLHEEGNRLTRIVMLCSQEVCSQKINIINGRTTLEYYEDSLWHFLEKYRDDYTDRASFFQVIPLNFEDQQSAEEIVAPIKRILEIAEDNSLVSDKHLYVDFTGGLRNAALTLVFACRILQRLGVTVDKILYSNLGTHIIEECTKTYEYFEHFEYLVKREYNPDNLERYDENMSRLPENEQKALLKIVTNMKGFQEKRDLNRLDEAVDVSKRAIADLKQVKSQLKDQLSENGKIILNRLEEDCEDIQDFVDKGKYPELPLIEKHLQRKQYDSALNLYREKIINIMYKGRIIQVGKRFLEPGKGGREGKLKEFSITQEIIGAYCYYEHPDNRNYSHKTFMDGVLYALEQLASMPDHPPKKVIEQYMNNSFYNIMWYLEKGQVPAKGFIHNDFSRKNCNMKILPFLSDDYGTDNMDTFIDKYNMLDRIYMCHGFPFAATYDKWFLNGYDLIYRRVLSNGIQCLQDFYDGKNNATIQRMQRCFPEEHFTYETLIHTLLQEEYSKMLHILFPYKLDPHNVYSNILKGEKWDEFIYSFVKSFCLIKNVRNKKIHKSDLESKEMQQAIEEIKQSLELIKKYIS